MMKVQGASPPSPQFCVLLCCLLALSPNLLDIYCSSPLKSFPTADLLTLHYRERLRGVAVPFSLQKKILRGKTRPGAVRC